MNRSPLGLRIIEVITIENYYHLMQSVTCSLQQTHLMGDLEYGWERMLQENLVQEVIFLKSGDFVGRLGWIAGSDRRKICYARLHPAAGVRLVCCVGVR